MSSENTFDKKTEKNYKYWENEFGPHQNYMIAEGNNEYDQIRKEIYSYIDEDDSVLDVGCACGDNLETFERLGWKGRYKGTDYASNFIKANSKRRPDVKWEEEDARQLSERANSYDVVILYDVLDALGEWEKALDEAVRVAKKKVIITMWMDAHMDDKMYYLAEKDLAIGQYEFWPKGTHCHYFLIAEKR